MATRPTVAISSADGTPSGSTHPLPAVFKSPIRPDIVQYELDCLILILDPVSLIESQDCPFRHGEEQEAAVCRERKSWAPDIRRVVGYR